MKIARVNAWALSAIALLLALSMAPALAHHKPSHQHGRGHKDGTTQPHGKGKGHGQGKGHGPKDKNGDGKPGKGNGNRKPKPPLTNGAPGNNGTIKIDGEPFDTSHGQEAHVGCNLRVLYFNFDEGPDLNSTLTFVAQAPTAGDFTFTDTITLGSGDPDVAGPYDLGAKLLASGIEPHSKQGWHVSLTTNTEYSQGADVKHKVFWVKCDDAEDNTPAAKPKHKSSLEQSPEVDSSTGTSTESDPTVLGTMETAADETQSDDSIAQEDAATLPFTGGDVLSIVLFGLVLIAGGVALMRLRRSSN
jgi:hypothetical protein